MNRVALMLSLMLAACASGAARAGESVKYAVAGGAYEGYYAAPEGGAITLQDFGALADQLEAAEVDHMMVTYRATPHAFPVFDSPSYREAADSKSWASFLEFLNESLAN